MQQPYLDLIAQLEQQIDKTRIITDPTLALAYGTDASFYRLTPQVVLQLDSLQEVIFAVKTCYEREISVTFRAAGTSLSGQAQSDSVLITLTRNWRDYKILNDGEQIWLQPGIIGAEVNAYLAPLGRKIGPDPGSINTCKIGGIVANNASGMCCGTSENSYRTVAGMTVVLADGTVLNTLDSASVEAFKLSHVEMIDELTTLVTQCQEDSELAAKIRHKYRLKNTTGYSLNSLIDFDDPIDVLQHLFIGSEGTLGFIADVTYNTVVNHAHKASGLFVFSDIEITCLAVSELSKTSVAAVELMDSRSLASVADKPGMPSFIAELGEKGDTEAAALLIEIHAESEAALQQQVEQLLKIINGFSPIAQVDFSRDTQICEQLWGIRKELFPSVGAVRETGTTVIIEDVAFPIEQLAPAVRELQGLFTQFNYHEAIIFGHALAGNLHFVFTQSFDNKEEITRYSDFMDAVAQLVAVDYKGSLKAEHGTGRNMAPFIELEWGSDGYQLMQNIKRIFDKRGILNPGVIINDDKESHIKNLKGMPEADELIDKCVECGFCEPVCPSRNLSLTPRQRNTVFREISRLRKTNEDPSRLAQMEKTYRYYGLDTCAATGLCADRCPVGINTGELVRKLRQNHTDRAKKIANWTADHFSTVTMVAKTGLTVAGGMHKVLGTKNMRKLTKAAYKLSGHRIPMWSSHMPLAAKSTEILTIKKVGREKIVYFPSCSARTMGTEAKATDPRPLMDVTISLLEKAGYEVVMPKDLNNQCCGMPYTSKGFPETAANKAQQLENALWEASSQGTYPVLMDTSPCASTGKETLRSEIKIYEPFEFVANYVLPKLTITQQEDPVMLHITCTSRRKGLAGVMEKVTKACAKAVIIPDDITCCGFAGDKGFTKPELNASALAPLKRQVPVGCTEGYSNSRTCELGLSEHSGIEYRSILYLVDKVSI
ncbi:MULTISPECIES: FAD-binding and (Fe-S)-binding domain-containing protein [unclassified Photobacterium]|uniref:FAD-binding and (Fe-S)-binding domain-containing protein n=1 Tax=unclassified Photobacterium TaxID=2628852 RepID=UPI001EDDF67E|nr:MULTISPECIES: FAD-binding and (Fe-S)-binding domain-containing protein [unclassified Photobacterium]MCG3863487.1 FAD-binding oxidoreductase [Photobacterium sp. Ph6]MCG3875016.1 FAD-binding oxidoreductase [Photobacterium sp. Ph5]